MFVGYKFSFPFLTIDSGLQIKDDFIVQPLYKHMININDPTLAIIGLQICAYTFMYDLQVILNSKVAYQSILIIIRNLL